jgi:epsilon-lactone hydrolase
VRAKAIGARALSVDYRRTPEHQHPAQLQDATAAYGWLLFDQGISADHIALTGDSAGGGLTITTMLRARRLALPKAAALMLSPWLDMELTGESLKSNRYPDALFGGE